MWFDDLTQLWRYESDNLVVKDFWHGRPCGKCDKHKTPEGHDPCLGTLPGVQNACCGHGDRSDAYVVFDNDTRLAGDDAIAFFEVARAQD